MNKLAILTSIALGLAGHVLAAQLRATSDDQAAEIAHLAPDQLMFADYCRQSSERIKNFSHADVHGDIRSRIVAALFGSVSEARNEPDESAAGQSRASMPGSPEWMVDIADSYLAIGKGAFEDLNGRLVELKSWAEVNNFRQLVFKACARINFNLVHELDGLFQNERKALAKENKQLEQLEFEQLRCLSTGRLQKVIRLCGYLSFVNSSF